MELESVRDEAASHFISLELMADEYALSRLIQKMTLVARESLLHADKSMLPATPWSAISAGPHLVLFSGRHPAFAAGHVQSVFSDLDLRFRLRS